MAFTPQSNFDYSGYNTGLTLDDYKKRTAQPLISTPNYTPAPAWDFSNYNFAPAQSGWQPTQQRNPDRVQFKDVQQRQVQQPKSTTASLSSRWNPMATDNEDEDAKKKAADGSEETADASEAIPMDDTIVGGDPVMQATAMPADPQILTLGGAAPAAPAGAPAAPGGDPRMQRFGMGMMGMGGPFGGGEGHEGGFGHFGGMHHGWLQQLMQRIQQRRQERMQQFAQSPQGQQFMASPMGQRMQSNHPDWFAPAAGAAAPAVPGAAPAGPAPAAPQTAAAAGMAAAQAPQPAAAPPTGPGAEAPESPRGPNRRNAQPRPMQQAPQQAMTRFPTLGGAGANRAIQEAMRRRNGMGGGGGGFGGMY